MDAPFAAQIYIDGTWTTVSAHTDEPARITGGRQKDAAVADPLLCSLKLRNDDGSLSARNPRGPYFGHLGRAVPARGIVPDDTHLWLPDDDAYVSTPDHASLDITGDLDVRADVQPLHWQRELGLPLAEKYLTTGNQRSWSWWVDDNMIMWLRWSSDGTFAAVIEVSSTEAIVPAGDGRIALRATLDVNNGAAGHTVVFYTSDTISGSWTQLGDPVVTAGTTSIFASTATLVSGTSLALPIDPVVGRLHALQVRSGIGGTVVANPDFTAQSVGATSFADSAGRTWSLVGDAEIRDFDCRASGEIADWPTRWTTSGRKRWASVEIGGWLRRLKLPSEPVRSPLFREATGAVNLPLMVGYWPCEDGSESTSLASGLTGGTTMTITGSPSLAASDRIPGSAPLLELATGVTLTGVPITHTGTGVIAVRMVADAPVSGWTADAVLCEVRAAGSSAVRWVLEVSNLGGLRIRGLDSTDTEIAATGYISFDVFGSRQMIGWQLTQVGSDVYWQMFTRVIADDLTVSEQGIDGTFTSRTVGRSTQLRIAPAGNLDGGSVGHIMLGTSATLAAGIDAAIVGNDGETAGRRLIRFGEEFDMPVRIIGHPDDTERMGPQKAGTKLELLSSCAAADRGILSEARDAMALEYRTRMSLYNQTPRAVLVYDTEGESPHLEPDDPTEDVVNDYTAERRGGSSYQARETAGRNSVAEHPDGVGPRPGGNTLDLETDDQLHDVAWWETHVGTWDDVRIPVVRVPLTRLVDAGKPELARAIAAAGPGDRLVITDPPPDLPPDPIDIQIQGWAEVIRPRRREITFNTLPHGPWVVGVAGVDLADSDGTTLVDPLTAVAAGAVEAVDVDVVGTPWPLDADVPFPMWILHPSGAKAERVTVTAISGATSPQTMTITRGLDGYTLAHDAGAELIMFQPLRWAR
ncbi:hypothetical protein GCM10010112_67960 [Actinoplanes lobatus]|uniref:Uncharacterized protein n=1 Tax=Actinoplanes lobatus TaxID=113568 RepID=A0A7W7HEN3_9ACTN|nr:hypothetical protein [Actinoplanes lobatus]MBB4749124.1 hypothetical protein [Actinoplanes lobatus]GGN86412.1 hypothetical protein GCM10010112_67960 [Actinoplanes lobatus]GIE42778.1 hypothetical protein Alo02nite_56760 [Actinoplanes lobatus]